MASRTRTDSPDPLPDDPSRPDDAMSDSLMLDPRALSPPGWPRREVRLMVDRGGGKATLAPTLLPGPWGPPGTPEALAAGAPPPPPIVLMSSACSPEQMSSPWHVVFVA